MAQYSADLFVQAAKVLEIQVASGLGLLRRTCSECQITPQEGPKMGKK